MYLFTMKLLEFEKKSIDNTKKPRPSINLTGILRRILTKYWPYLILLVFWLSVILPWFLDSGFILLLDFIPVPHISRPPLSWQYAYLDGLLYRWPAWLISQFFPAALTHKMLFSLPIALAGISMYQLCSLVLSDKNRKIVAASSLLAGLYYAYNPFITTRVFMGHVFFIYGYALLPWVVLSWLKFQQKPTLRPAFYLALFFVASVLFSQHHFILVPLLLLFLYQPVRPRTSPEKRSWLLLFFFVATVVTLAITVYFSSDARPNTLHPLGPWSRALLAPYSGSYAFDVLNLSATWKIDLPFLFPWELRLAFGYISFLLLLIMASGLWWLKHQHHSKNLAIPLLLVILFSSFLAVGIAHPLISPLAVWLYHHVPFWIGLRDSAKFLSILALVESILLAVGVYSLTQLWTRHFRRVSPIIVPATALILVVYISSTAVYGYNNQIYPTSYPDSWQEAQTWLADNHSTPPSLLFLPWHMYLPFSFTQDRTIANPASTYFTSAHVIVGNNNEVGGTFGRPFISAEYTDPTHQYIQQLLPDTSSFHDFGSRLSPLCMQYIMLATDTRDVSNYDFLYNQNDLEIVFSRQDLIIWQNIAVQDNCKTTIL